MNCFEMWKPFGAMVVVDFAFAIVNILFKKALTGGLNYLASITYRQAIAAISLAPIAYSIERKSWPSLTCRMICILFFNALLGLTITMYLFLIGLKYTSATYSCAFLNMVPVTTFVMALCFGLEKLNMKSKSGRAKVLGTLICVCGALTLTLYKGIAINNTHAQSMVQRDNDDEKHDAKRWAIGSLFLALGILSWSSWFLVQSRIGKSYPFPYSSTAIMSFFSAIQSAILSLVIDRNIDVWILKGPLEYSTVIFSGMVGSGLCYVVMCWCIKVRGPVFTSAFSPFIQMFVAIFDISMLHEQIHLGSVLGSLLVVAGMYILLWGKSYETETCRQAQEIEKNEECNREIQVKIPDTNDCSSRA